MKIHLRIAIAALAFAALPLAAQQRIASDYEIAAATKAAEREHDAINRVASYLNLGDLYLSREERQVASTNYRKAMTLAGDERRVARGHSDLRRYATATAYVGLASAKLGDDEHAFDMLEEAIRYGSDDTKLWNLYASAMLLSGRNGKAIATARNSVEIAAHGNPTAPGDILELDIARYTLSSALLATQKNDDRAEAERVLRSIVTSLGGDAFEPIRAEISRKEMFEIYSSVRGDAPAYLSLVIRSRLRLGNLYEETRRRDSAVHEYGEVLRLRSDEPTALTALARLSANPADRERYFADAFDANPFSLRLIDDYESFLREQPNGSAKQAASTGSAVRAVLRDFQQQRYRESQQKIDALLTKFPSNEVLVFLKARIDSALGNDAEVRSALARLTSPELKRRLQTLDAATRAEAAKRPPFLATRQQSVRDPRGNELALLLELFRANRLTASERAQLDRMTFSSSARFDDPQQANGVTTIASGSVEAIPFVFMTPTSFRGSFDATGRLDYRVLGTTEKDDAPALLVEPIRVVNE